ncbi:cytochrome P450 [Vararia minispora EC-137]|uniref:Cytochrome P450 n=1 Tax=Vararia minispora EC-137 TaxID=1314806 RepID=A0ACB8QGI1_9AGAM|nr:cytochrome P450 [Vararia minispora EC-137]
MALLPLLPLSVTVAVCLPLYVLVSRFVRQRPLDIVPGPASVSFITGVLTLWFGEDAIPYQEKTMERYGRVIGLPGIFGGKLLSIADTKAIYEILVKNQDTFEELDSIRELVLLSVLVCVMLSNVHRKQRKLMNPAFSINHMRRIMPIFLALSRKVRGIYECSFCDRTGPLMITLDVDVMDYCSRFALDLIAQAGFGHSFGSIDGKDEGYSAALKKFDPTTSKLALGIILLPLLTKYIPGHILRTVAEKLPWPTLHVMLNISDTMQSTSRDIWEEKKKLFALGDKSVVNEYGEGKDIMSILLKSNLAASDEERLTDEELLAQINTFTLAGADTTSHALARIIHLLALHPEVQEKLREELTEACTADGEIGHDDLVELPYLEAVCRETLRLYPPAPVVYRQCMEDAVLPLAHSYTDTTGKERNELIVPGGSTMVIVNIVGVNRDKAIWGPDAHEWKPERWLSPLPDSVAEARIPGVYANTLTFIGGSRACIGFKFAQLEMKAALSQLVPRFRIAPSLDHEIVWRFGGILTPFIKGSKANKSELPLRLTPIV